MPMPRRTILTAVVVAALLALSGIVAIASTRLVAGPRSDGTGVTPNGWLLTPAGRQVDLTDQVHWGDRPDGQALSPDGKTLLISSGGQSLVTMKVVDTATRTVRQTIPYRSPEALFIGVVWSQDGKRAFASAGGNNKVRTYTFDGQLQEGASIPVPGFPTGLALSGDGSTLFVAENTGDALGLVELATGKVTNVPVGPCDVTQLVPFQGGVAAQCQPYGVALSEDGATAYVSNWGEHSLTAVDVAARTVRTHIQVGNHPNALAVNPSRSSPELFVANAGNNDVDVISLNGKDEREGDGRSGPILGMIPTAWYPTGVSVSPDGRTLYVENAKGLGAGPNPNGTTGSSPRARRRCSRSRRCKPTRTLCARASCRVS